MSRVHYYACYCSVIILIFIKNATCFNEVLLKSEPLYGFGYIAQNLKSTNKCFEELSEIKNGIDIGQVWAIKALDSSGKPSSRFIYGNNIWIGSHSQCQDISNRKKLEINNDKSGHIETKFDFPDFEFSFANVLMEHNSTIQMHTRMPLGWKIQLGLCVPKSCNATHIFELSDEYFKNYFEMGKIYLFSVKIEDVKILKEDLFFLLNQPKTIILISLFFTITILTIIGTTRDVKKTKSNKNRLLKNGTALENVESKNIDEKMNIFDQILTSFSFKKNVETFLKITKKSDSISCLNGLRFLGMLWVIMAHTIFFQTDFYDNPVTGFRMAEDFASQIVSNSIYAVDTYLFLSGFLLGYLFLKNKNPHKETKKSETILAKVVQFVLMYLNRYLRLTFPYIFLIIFCDVLYTYFWETSALIATERNDILCDKYWWRNLLYINNLYPRSEMCLSWSWYLSLDTQLFILSSILLILSTINFSFASILSIFLILLSMCLTAYSSYKLGYIPTLDEQLATLDELYDLPWLRMGPYLIGIISSYILVIKLQFKLHLNKLQKTICWTLFPMLNLWILFTIYTRNISVEFSAFYMGISHTLWGVGIGWLTLACCTKNAGILDKFLSFKGFVPLAKLTYCAYLLNPIITVSISQGMQMPQQASTAQMAIFSSGIMFLTFLFAFLFSMLIEFPFVSLTKIALNKIMKPSKSRLENNNCT